MSTLQLLGYLFNWGLFGVLSLQVYLYYIAFPRDRWTLKTLVYSVYVIETVQTILVTYDAFNEYASGFGSLEALDAGGLNWISVPIFSGIVSAMVQIHYAYRVSIVSGSRILGLAISVVTASYAVRSVSGRQSNCAYTVALQIWLAATAVCDVIIAGCMTLFLLRHDIMNPEMHALITRLVRLVVGTGMLTALAATIDLVLFLAFPHRAYHGCIALTLAKLYSNSLLVLFNSRIRIVDGRLRASELAGNGSNSMLAKSQPGVAGIIRYDPFATHAALLGGVHVHEVL
ncbi:uncharacterized protein PHACADRAFT_148756 [Phanerochaete carnosa HHB-10118-sp]|uniref:DUF6534 domain-containing protein n=1 Tax=Phanerochaete carnosa (strain HHB-10118-sp) TaxID=650164 RepID=K5W032_PHACS|nr:uncharacterized protein PHACADRAFT_148756 [Phanerochaete carnosa HHB-10118-sp]EKM52239.1 hypothetical protein PHACADRAFT_148756 [Phanerochaete carnosa HHB-10118-sp]